MDPLQSFAQQKKKIRHNQTFVPTPLEVGNENGCIQTLGAACSRTTPLGVAGSGATPLEVGMNVYYSTGSKL